MTICTTRTCFWWTVNSTVATAYRSTATEPSFTSAQLEDVPTEIERRSLGGRALLPGMVDIHSHAFQRALRGRAESRRRSGPDFWSWRDIHVPLRARAHT